MPQDMVLMAILYNICPGFHISVIVLWLVSYHLSRVQGQKKNEASPEQWKIRFNGQNEYEHQKQMGWSLWYYHFDMKTNCFPWIFLHLQSTSNIETTCTQSVYEVKQWAAILRVVSVVLDLTQNKFSLMELYNWFWKRMI